MFSKWSTTGAEAGDQAGERSQGMKDTTNGWVLTQKYTAIKLAQHFCMSGASSSNPLFKITIYIGSGMGFTIKLSSLLNSEFGRIL